MSFNICRFDWFGKAAKRISQISNPAGTLFICDVFYEAANPLGASQYMTGDAYSFDSPFGAASNRGYRHSRQLNIVYVDSHAQSTGEIFGFGSAVWNK
jgi:prepilin-type processing-associated H-X9-DG protein